MTLNVITCHGGVRKRLLQGGHAWCIVVGYRADQTNCEAQIRFFSEMAIG